MSTCGGLLRHVLAYKKVALTADRHGAPSKMSWDVQASLGTPLRVACSKSRT